jgi:hypothetical protein
MGGGCRQLVGLPDDEGLEGVALIERRGAAGRGRGSGGGRNEEVHLRAGGAFFLDLKDDVERLAEHLGGNAGEDPGVLRRVPLDGELVGRRHDELAFREGNRAGGLQPSPDGGVG